MIRRSWSHDKWMLTYQPEHARLAGLIASSWNFGAERPSDEALYAVAHHDDGWKQADEQPRINRRGEPMSFMEIDALAGIEIWSRSSQQLAEEKKFYAARLAAAHFTWLAENTVDLARISPRTAVAVGKYLFDQKRSMEQWARDGRIAAQVISDRDVKLMLSPDAPDEQSLFRRDLRLLQVCDQLSLLLCTDFVGEMEITDVPFLEGTDRLRVARKGDTLTMMFSPFPLKMRLRDHLVSYLLPKRPYESDDDLREAISATRPTTNEVHFGQL